VISRQPRRIRPHEFTSHALRLLKSMPIPGAIFGLVLALFAFPSAFAQPSSTMEFRLASTGGASCCEWISAEGPITQRTPEDFVSFVNGKGIQGAAETIYLSSPGGDLIAGMRLGEVIRKRKFGTTTKGGRCMSACAYAFLGGITREADAGQIGFHQFFMPLSADAALGTQSGADDASATQALVGLIAIYLKEMEIDPEVLFLASGTEPKNIYLPDADTLVRLKITTRTNDEFGGWTIEPYQAGAVVTGTWFDTHDQKTQLTFFCRKSNPDTVFLLASWNYPAPVQDFRNAILGSRLKLGGFTVREHKGMKGVADLHADNTGRYLLTFPLTTSEYARALQSDIAVEIDVPHVYGRQFQFVPPISGLKERTAIAFRSCL
jgi:hypothetical protein